MVRILERLLPPKHEYPRNMVLNHRMLCSLSRGDIREGFLLAVGKVRPPETYHDGEIIPIRFSILDQWDCHPSVTLNCRWCATPSAIFCNQTPRAKHKPLFSCPDRIAPVEKREASNRAKSAKEEKQLHAHIEK